MKAVILLCSVFCALGMDVLASSRKSPGQVSLMHFVDVLEYYGEKNDGYPISWEGFDEKIKADWLPIIEKAVKLVDLKNRYVFFDPPPELVIYGKKEKFIMMATDAELEGVSGADTYNPNPGRYLIVEVESGKLALRRYSEVGLKRVLGEEGLDLVDYTKKRTFKTSVIPKLPRLYREVLLAVVLVLGAMFAWRKAKS